MPIVQEDAYHPRAQNEPVQKDDIMKPSSRYALAGLALIAGTAALPCLPVIGAVTPAMAASAPAPSAPLTLKVLKVEGNSAVATADIMAVLPYHVATLSRATSSMPGCRKWPTSTRPKTWAPSSARKSAS
ncbi:hypothetical protein [Asaia platycodi]|uniref:hypothetical protein n=1 Tax=Asaia platycodi TaxID=610243 RepID=UPI000686EB3D|nr:hypothetical protein [Asaia platycodi]